MLTTKPKAVLIDWLEQHLLPKLGNTLMQDLSATLDELKRLPTSVSYHVLLTIYHPCIGGLISIQASGQQS